jgi:hypothetical protein
MAQNKALAVVLLALGGFAGLAVAGEERGGDLVPAVPVAQKRLFDFRYYGGPGMNNPLVLSPDGKYAVGTPGGNQLMVYELSRKAPRNNMGRPLLVENANFFRAAVAFLPDSKTVVAMSSNFPDMTLHFFDVATGKETRQIDNDQQFQGLAMSPDGKLLALGSNPRVEIWDAATTDEVRTLTSQPNHFYQVLAFSADSRMLAAAPGNTDQIEIWEVASGRVRRTLRLSAQPTPGNVPFPGAPGGNTVSALAFSADGALVAVAGTDNSIHLFDLRGGQELPPLVGHQQHVSSLVFTADGRRLLSLDGQGLRLEWDARRLGKAGAGKVRPPSDAELDDLWEGLADADAFQTYRAVRLLAAAPERALALLRKYLKAVPPGNTEEISRLVADLSNPVGSVRRKAMTGLRNHGEAALGALRQLPPNVGFNQNVMMMTQRLDRVYNTSDRQRALKGVLVLEGVGSPEAKQLLEELARGAAGAPLTVAAKAALDRLKSRPAADPAHAQGPEALWGDLAGADAPRAFQAILQLAARPQTTLPWLREHVKPAPVPEPRHLDELVAALNDSSFRARDKAMTELEKLGETAGPALKQALAGDVPLEVRRRLERLLAKLNPNDPSSYQLRQLRALEVIEQIGTPEARQLLQELAQGAPAARLTREARASLDRLSKITR